ncbi:hypothetical protein [Deinococcus yavapaiensis]|uniref:Uncharacterized protein n=1 Tax=Deinococcus yavapaiensis KR-236 TaxID=694435 RepID=A0A318SLP0_9DEIO|nr:hypothetical protein [Deinococcus yavapaiensis]PYE55449.1 hypothetical protein DES52_103282 [Deinococcus yavapaiensis KR-236]
MNTARPDARLFPTLALVVWPTPTPSARLASASSSLRPSLFPALASVRWQGSPRVGA